MKIIKTVSQIVCVCGMTFVLCAPSLGQKFVRTTNQGQAHQTSPSTSTRSASKVGANRGIGAQQPRRWFSRSFESRHDSFYFQLNNLEHRLFQSHYNIARLIREQAEVGMKLSVEQQHASALLDQIMAIRKDQPANNLSEYDSRYELIRANRRQSLLAVSEFPEPNLESFPNLMSRIKQIATQAQQEIEKIEKLYIRFGTRADE